MPVPNKGGWSGVTLPWMSTGYEMQLTPIHMLTFYNSVANALGVVFGNVDGKSFQRY